MKLEIIKIFNILNLTIYIIKIINEKLNKQA